MGYLDATATHRNRGPEDIARYAILVTVAEDGAIGPHTFLPAADRALRYRYSDEAMLALAKYIYSLQPPPNPNRPNDVTARGEQVFERADCARCHPPPLYTNNRLVPVDGFTPVAHPSSPPASDVMRTRVGLDPGLALKTRKGTGYYKVPSLRGHGIGTVRALGLDCDARRVVRSRPVARRLRPQRMEPAGYTRAAHPGPPVRVEPGG